MMSLVCSCTLMCGTSLSHQGVPSLLFAEGISLQSVFAQLSEQQQQGPVSAHQIRLSVRGRRPVSCILKVSPHTRLVTQLLSQLPCSQALQQPVCCIPDNSVWIVRLCRALRWTLSAAALSFMQQSCLQASLRLTEVCMGMLS